MSALESLEAIQKRLIDLKVRLHLSKVKGPVMDRLVGIDFLVHLSGRIHLDQHQAMLAIAKCRAEALADAGRHLIGAVI